MNAISRLVLKSSHISQNILGQLFDGKALFMQLYVTQTIF